MRDKYSEQINRLVNGPAIKINTSWGDAEGLFQFCGPTDNIDWIGCLTMIHTLEKCVCEDPTLTAFIKADDRIVRIDDIAAAEPKQRREMLEVFAEWQRRLDSELPSRRIHADLEAINDNS